MQGFPADFNAEALIAEMADLKKKVFAQEKRIVHLEERLADKETDEGDDE